MPCIDATTCSPCSNYDNCGCINPTDFECVSKPGACEGLGITDDMNGLQAMAKVCEKYGDLVADKGKVSIDSSDTCPEYLWDKLEEGLNISFTQTGTGCDRKIVINAVDGGTPIDIKAKVSSTDTTSGYLATKIDTGAYLTKTISNPSGNEVLNIDVVPVTLISSDPGNMLGTGTDGGLLTTYTAPDGSETKIVNGTGVGVTGTGTVADPYVISTNPAIQIARTCFDATWRNLSLVATGNPNVVYVSGIPKYRYRFDGSIEFKGSATYTVAYGAYSTSNRKFIITVGNIPTTCITLVEQAGVSDLKSINYIDIPQASADQITQLYGYIIRKSVQNLIVEFQSSFSASTSKTIVVNFDGVISHPSI